MIKILSNPGYLLSPLIVSGVIAILLFLVGKSRRTHFERLGFAGLLLTLGLSSLFTFAMRYSPDTHHALLWDRAIIATAILSYALYYHFTLVYTSVRIGRWVAPVIYLSMAIMAAVATATSLVVEDMRLEYYGHAPVIGPLLPIIYMAATFFIAGGIFILLRGYRASPSYEERNRLLYLAIASFFPLLGAGLDSFSDLPPMSIWANLAFGIVCSVAVLKYHLLDIRIVIRKSLSYILISAIIAVPYVAILYFTPYLFGPPPGLWWVHGLIILLLAVILRPLYTLAQQYVDRIFYRGRYDYLRALQEFSHEIQSAVALDQLGPTLLRLVGGALQSSSASLLLATKDNSGLAVTSSIGLDNPPFGIVLRDKSLLVKWMKVYGNIISSGEFDIIPELRGLTSLEKQTLRRIGAELLIPIRSRGHDLIGLLVLGPKLSEQPYYVEDRRLLSTLGSQMATTLENIRLYNEAIEARENLETWLDSMSDGVLIVNLNYTIQFMNKAAAGQFGSRNGRICWGSLGKDARCSDCPIELYSSGARSGVNYSSPIGDKEYDVATAPLIGIDGTLSLIEVFRDVTERKRMEEKEKKLQQELNLAGRLASIGELAAGVAHELNNPLTGILGFSDRLMRKSADDLVRRDLQRIHSQAERAATIVENLLAFARQRKPMKEYCDINDILQKTLELRAYELRTSNIETEIELASGLPMVMVDFRQMQEVFLNIILNAEQAISGAKNRGKLSIKTELIDRYIKISLADDGPGIPPEYIDRLFHPFFTTREETGGTGLGLSICHGIITKHGGRIYAKSELGKGATFVVELPVN